MNPAQQPPDDQLDRALDTLLAARKYRSVHPGLARAIAAAELAKGRSLKEAVKATKNQLHQSAAVYLRRNLNHDDALRQLQTTVHAAASGTDNCSPADNAAVRALLRRLMAAHASTHERLPLLDTFYSQLFQQLPPVPGPCLMSPADCTRWRVRGCLFLPTSPTSPAISLPIRSTSSTAFST